ncbi:MAG: hypothetical protein RL417_572 [Pseudomonadota bacterium]|jgi:hypothetical protein
MTDSATVHRSPDKLFLALFACAIVVVGGLWLGIQLTIAPSKETAVELLRAPTPPTLNALYSAKTSSGDVAEFFDKSSNHKFSLAISAFADSPASSPRALLDAIVEFQKSGAVNAGFSPLSVKFSQALITGRRAYELVDGSVTVNGTALPVLQFVTNKGANHAIAVIHRGSEQVVVLALKKNSPVDSGVFGRFLEQIRPAGSAAPPTTP